MKIIVTGQAVPLRYEIIKSFELLGHEVTLVTDRKNWPAGNYDFCLDTGAGGIQDIRHTMAALDGKKIHYILLSTYKVYPGTPRLVPWRSDIINLCDEAGIESLDVKIRGKRAAERELKLCAAHRRIAWTILRPAIVELKHAPEPQNMWWFVSRILDGQPLVLPDGDDPLFRHVSGDDLLGAVLAVAGKEKAYYETIHVVDSALLTFESYARLIMNGLKQEVPVRRVPADIWNASELTLPMGHEVHSSFIDSSLLLHDLGWRPADEGAWVGEYALQLSTRTPPVYPSRQRELAVLNAGAKQVVTSACPLPEGWRLTGVPGRPSSFGYQWNMQQEKSAYPVFQTRKVALSLCDELFLTEEAGANRKILGQNVLLELLESAESHLNIGDLFLPLHPQSCLVKECGRCHELANNDDDGFARDIVQEDPAHLIPIPAELAEYALLAHPLSCLLSVLPYVFQNVTGPVWIYGRRVESILAGFLAADSEKIVTHVDRSLDRNKLPKEMMLLSLNKTSNAVRNKTEIAPAAVINLSGTRDGENLLAGALRHKGFLVSPFVVTQNHSRRLNVNLPVYAPGKNWVEMAVRTLRQWAQYRDLKNMVRQVPVDQPSELFMTGTFQLPFLEILRLEKTL